MYSEAINILIIDDNPGDVFLVEQILVDNPGRYLIEKAETLEEGILRYKNFQTHIILLDLSLPDSVGLETFEQLKKQVKDIPIIILTGMNDQSLAVQAVRMGAQDYLVKDELSEGLLTRSIKYALERFGAEEKRRWLETKMLYSQKLESLSVLSSGIAHNFNSLLTAIIGNSEIAMKKIPKDSSAYRNLERIQTSAREAAELSNQMLAYSGRGRFVVKALDISQLIEEIKPILKAAITDNTQIIYTLGNQLPLIKADIPQIKQLILTLVINATEAINGGGGTIKIKTCRVPKPDTQPGKPGLSIEIKDTDYLLLEIRDDGPGIQPENLYRVFEPFFTTKFTGRGLGLAAAEGIVRGHGGSIKLENGAEKGVVVKVFLPEILEDS